MNTVRENSTTLNAIKGLIKYLVLPIIVAIVSFYFTHQYTESDVKNGIVQSLADHYDFIEQNMTYEQALDQLHIKISKMNTEIESLQSEKNKLESEALSAHEVEIESPSLIYDGLKKQSKVNQGILILDDNRVFYSEGVLKELIVGGIKYDSEQNEIQYNPNAKTVSGENKIALLETNSIYDGKGYRVFRPSDSDGFSMGSGNYSNGFTIHDDNGLFGSGNGYALFDLQGKYSKITFKVGRVNVESITDAVLKVYLDNTYVTEFKLYGQSPPVEMSIDLNYANNMKLEVVCDYTITFGFADVVLYF